MRPFVCERLVDDVLRDVLLRLGCWRTTMDQ